MRKSSSVVMYHPVSVRKLALCRSVCCAAVPENALADRASKAHAGGHAQTHRNTTVQQSRYHVATPARSSLSQAIRKSSKGSNHHILLILAKRLLAGILLDIVSAVKYKQPIEDRGVYLGKVSDERSEHLGGLGLRSKNNAITNNIFDQQTA
ncbi:hypothetical protein E3P81_02229 [Wallemia ichthyophaga]|nr:hypothetical protein E3P91_02115 [Wallemia ichthyophaga]TIA91048.1 hypothetical protein E3P97_02228 [Wallemia ichthyophaga]TIB32528.1 hypothetical protein E3P85_01777 [Wallemia ichthyophaga]TIB46412.1 hypothetical protein E3P82_02226 [Wallemia ichthyophaga]TIB50339.1 hypothetical protein E3P81_02229 [Wallemia ichthyophaga]